MSDLTVVLLCVGAMILVWLLADWKLFKIWNEDCDTSPYKKEKTSYDCRFVC